MSIDKTRQDKTSILGIIQIVKWWYSDKWIIHLITLSRVLTAFMIQIIYAPQFLLVPVVTFNRKLLQGVSVDLLTKRKAIAVHKSISKIAYTWEILL